MPPRRPRKLFEFLRDGSPFDRQEKAQLLGFARRFFTDTSGEILEIARTTLFKKSKQWWDPSSVNHVIDFARRRICEGGPKSRGSILSYDPKQNRACLISGP